MKKLKIKLNKLVYPLFVKDGKGLREEVKNMPGIFRFSLDTLIPEIRQITDLGLKSVLLFGVAKKKDKHGFSAYQKDNIVNQAIIEIKRVFKDIRIITDVCLCAYTLHGHCGIIKRGSKVIDNKETLKVLAKIALEHARCGADYVAPSAMARHQVSAIRTLLNKYGFYNTKIMGYSAKYFSNFYRPFREAANSYPAFGDRSAYQLDYSSSKQAIMRIKSDVKEGADIVMVKPALSYLDVIKEAKAKITIPLAAYNVSGEYSMVKYGVKLGLWQEKDIVNEIITSIMRAGADIVITYHAKDIARWQKKM